MNLQEWRESGLQLIQTLRARGEERSFRKLLSDIYSDKTHFIYELFQNAEDANASECRFTLSKSGLEFEHDGIRLFTEDDVKSITSFGNSTKPASDDSTAIGKFGIGFKAVFAYTNTPEIHSGIFHFRIHDLIVLEIDGVPRVKMHNRKTRFIFPFDNPKKPSKQAAEEVERKLLALGDNTLLFLSHIRKIEYLLPDGNLGTLERVEKENGRIEIHTSQPGAGTTVSHWLRFEKDVEVTDEDGKHKTYRIAVAYSLTEEAQKKGNAIWKIVPLAHGQVSIYFPAENADSHLRFHIHAPFASTVARDSVRDCEANQSLRDHLADLVVESLIAIRDLGLLTVGFLAVLPNPQDSLPDFYEPIRDAIVQAFMDDALTPTKSGSHAPASALYRGPARIQEVIDDDDLSLLTQHETPLWAKNPPQENQREARFMDGLEIEAWGWGELAAAVHKPFDHGYFSAYKTSNDEYVKRIEAFIAEKEDAWLLRFYALLGEACDIHGESIKIGNLLIIRVTSDTSNQHATAKGCYFLPEEDADSLPSDVLFVKPSVYAVGRSEPQKKAAKSFLEQAGVRPYDAKAGIERLLGQYRNSRSFALKLHIKHIRQFIRYWKENPSSTGLFDGAPFVVDSVNDGRVEETYAPADLCLDEPYEPTGLADLGDIHGKPAVWAGYQTELNTSGLKDFIAFIKAVGVMYELRVEKTNTNENENVATLRQDYYRPGVRWTDTAIDHDFSIPEINKYLSENSVPASRLIWNALCHADKKCAAARFRPNRQYNPRETDSQLVLELKRWDWIPDKSGELRIPGDMTKDDLRTDFPYDDRNGLLTAIGFGENVRKRSEVYQSRDRDAQKMGFNSMEEAEEIAQLMKRGLTLKEIRSWATQRNKINQPEESVPDPNRRRMNVLANTADAPSKESVRLERSVQKGLSVLTAQAKAYLRAKYKNSEGQLVCQCCKAEMPFKLPRTEEYYFEAVQCIGDKDTRHFQSRLALCPTCAAMYQYARETDDTELRQHIVNHTADDRSAAVEIPVRLAGRNHTLHFVGTHWFDLKTVLQVVNG